MPFIIGRKVEMTQQFKDDGTVVPVTLIKAEPNIVTQIREESRDGYVAVQVGSEVTTKSLVKSEAGHLTDLPQVKTLREFRVARVPENYVRGAKIRVSDFVPGTKVDIVGVSKGRGFAGVMKRHHFSGSKATHGNKDQQRMGGSIGSQRQGKVIKGQRMGGHMGDVRVTVKNLEVVSFDADKNLLAVKGAIPGERGGLILVRSHERKQLWQ